MRNIHIIGKSGTGKTSTLNRFALEDIYSSKPIAYFGRSADFILSHIPKRHRERTVLFNPSDTEYPIGWNPFQEPDAAVETVKALYGVGIAAPNLTLYLSASLRAVPDKTVPNVARMLLDGKYRKSLTVKNKDLARFWEWYENQSERDRGQKVDSTLNKIYAFLTDDTVRNIVSQKAQLPDLSDKILVVPLNKRPLSGEKLSLIASLMIATLDHSGYQGTFYLDDVHRLAPMVVYSLLDDGASIVAAHHYLAQLDDAVREAFLGRATTTIAFRLSATDARTLREQFAILDGDNTLHDPLEQLPPFEAHVITPKGLQPQQSMPETNKPPIPGSVEWIVRNSRERYARPRAIVEAMLNGQ